MTHAKNDHRYNENVWEIFKAKTTICAMQNILRCVTCSEFYWLNLTSV